MTGVVRDVVIGACIVLVAVQVIVIAILVVNLATKL